MLNLGMTEIFCFAVIALLVLGPDKLPEAARFVAKWYGKVKRLVSNVQNDIDRELRLSELREQMQQEMQRIAELEQRLQKQLDELKTQNHEVETAPSVTKPQNSIRYVPYHSSSIIPFCVQYQKSSVIGMEAYPSLNQFDNELKIAV